MHRSMFDTKCEADKRLKTESDATLSSSGQLDKGPSLSKQSQITIITGEARALSCTRAPQSGDTFLVPFIKHLIKIQPANHHTCSWCQHYLWERYRLIVLGHEGADTVQPCCYPRTDQPKERKKGNVLMQSGLFQLLTQAFKLFNTGATVADAAVKAIKYLKKERKTERVDSNQTRQSQQELLSPSKMLFFSCFWLVYCYKKMTPFRMKMSHLLWSPCLFLIMHSHFLKSKGL